MNTYNLLFTLTTPPLEEAPSSEVVSSVLTDFQGNNLNHIIPNVTVEPVTEAGEYVMLVQTRFHSNFNYSPSQLRDTVLVATFADDHTWTFTDPSIILGMQDLKDVA